MAGEGHLGEHSPKSDSDGRCLQVEDTTDRHMAGPAERVLGHRTEPRLLLWALRG
jgi:hypothetical protein